MLRLLSETLKSEAMIRFIPAGTTFRLITDFNNLKATIIWIFGGPFIPVRPIGKLGRIAIIHRWNAQGWTFFLAMRLLMW